MQLLLAMDIQVQKWLTQLGRKVRNNAFFGNPKNIAVNGRLGLSFNIRSALSA
jgi:hypothetical protein